MKIKEVIVVEGRDDLDAVKKAVDAEIIITHGFGISEKTFQLIKGCCSEKGVIILTDQIMQVRVYETVLTNA